MIQLYAQLNTAISKSATNHSVSVVKVFRKAKYLYIKRKREQKNIFGDIWVNMKKLHHYSMHALANKQINIHAKVSSYM